MKAYIVSEKATYEKQVLVFAETISEAKTKALRKEEMDDVRFIDLLVKRAHYADGYENAKDHEIMVLNIKNGWWYEIGGVHIDKDNLADMQEKGII